MSQLKYLCTRTNNWAGGKWKAGVIYTISSGLTPPIAFFFTTTEDPRALVFQGSKDLDKTYYPQDGGVGWIDMRFAASRDKQGQTSKPDFDFTEIGLLMPQNDPTEIAYINDQFPHEMVDGATIKPHAHWMQTAAGQEPVFKIDFRAADNGSEMPAAFTTYASSGPGVFDYDGSGRMIQITSIAEIDLSALSVTETSALFDIKLYRDDNAVVGDVLLKTFDIHIPIDAPQGSGQEFIK